MIKFRYILFVAIFSIVIYSCGEESNTASNFDSAAQAVKDDETITNFLKKHYFDSEEDIVKPLVEGKTALFKDNKLKKQTVTENNIDYKLYYYVDSVGVKNSPSVVDSVFVNYYGQRIVNVDSISTKFDSGSNIWFTLGSVIKGWSYGFTHFKGGIDATKNGPVKFNKKGTGLLFIPSGLAYENRGTRNGKIKANENIFFYVELLKSKKADADQDGIASINEDLNGDGIPWNDDTDKDGIPNYLDSDDDNDQVLTRYEDANLDSDPTNDFSDPKRPTVPNYLNFYFRKIYR